MGRGLARGELPVLPKCGTLLSQRGRVLPRATRLRREERTMHVGLATGFAHQRGDAYPDAQFIREELENLVLAEELGFDSVWITEHHFTDYSMSNDPLQLLTYLAGRTRRVKLGTQVIIVPWRDPVRLAEAIINLDHVSNGRAILGFGGGLSPDEFSGLRVDQNKSRALYNDILDMVIPAIETGILEGESET